MILQPGYCRVTECSGDGSPWGAIVDFPGEVVEYMLMVPVGPIEFGVGLSNPCQDLPLRGDSPVCGTGQP